MFGRLGGEHARQAAERYFRDPNRGHFAEFMATCWSLYNPTPPDPDLLTRALLRPEVNFHFFGGEGCTYDWSGDPGRIRCPTLILAGDLDPVTTVADHQDMATGIPGSRLEAFPGAGHGVFRDKPAAALAVIRDFALAAHDQQAPATGQQVTP